jgi:L-malate glycosyltransferase
MMHVLWIRLLKRVDVKVLIVANGYPTNKYKMHGIFAYDQAKALASAGHQVIYAVVDLRSIRRWRNWGLSRHVNDGIPIYEINIPCGRVPLWFLLLIGSHAARILYKRILRDHPDIAIVHAHFTEHAYMAARLPLGTDVPLVVTEHSSSMNKDQLLESRFRMAKYAYEHATILICVGSAVARRIQERFGIEAEIVPNIVDSAVFKWEPSSPGHIFTMISTGSLIPLKRTDLLIAAFQRALGSVDAELYIFGEGPERRNLEKTIAEGELTDRVHLMGRCSREVIAERMKGAACFALLSTSETFGVACIEALAMGLPVIATRSGGPEDYITEENGILVDVDDEESIVCAMKSVYDHHTGFDGKRISTTTIRRFSPEIIARSLTRLYESVERKGK